MTEIERIKQNYKKCRDLDCCGCPYTKHCETDFIKDLYRVLKKYDTALRLMVYQYCTHDSDFVENPEFHHHFTSAGEHAFKLLGIKNGETSKGFLNTIED